MTTSSSSSGGGPASAPAAVSPLTPESLAALSWYASVMAGAPVQQQDLHTVAELAQPVVRAVKRAAARDLAWTDAQQAFAPHLFSNAKGAR